MIQAWGVGAGSVGIAGVGLALVDVGAAHAVAVEAGVAGALEAAVGVVAGGVGVTVVLAVWALVIIGTCESVAGEAWFTCALVQIGAVGIGVTGVVASAKISLAIVVPITNVVFVACASETAFLSVVKIYQKFTKLSIQNQ